MGKYHQGVAGDFSGKAGPVVGRFSRGARYTRDRSRPVKNRKVTDKIEKQRARFKLASDFITSISGLLAISYAGFKDGITAHNSILANVIRQAITGEYRDLRIEYSKVDRGLIHCGRCSHVVVAFKLSSSLTLIQQEVL